MHIVLQMILAIVANTLVNWGVQHILVWGIDQTFQKLDKHAVYNNLLMTAVANTVLHTSRM